MRGQMSAIADMDATLAAEMPGIPVVVFTRAASMSHHVAWSRRWSKTDVENTW